MNTKKNILTDLDESDFVIEFGGGNSQNTELENQSQVSNTIDTDQKKEQELGEVQSKVQKKFDLIFNEEELSSLELQSTTADKHENVEEVTPRPLVELNLSDIDVINEFEGESTQKTIMFENPSLEYLASTSIQSKESENVLELQNEIQFTEETKDKIEATINEIVRPSLHDSKDKDEVELPSIPSDDIFLDNFEEKTVVVKPNTAEVAELLSDKTREMFDLGFDHDATVVYNPNALQSKEGPLQNNIPDENKHVAHQGKVDIDESVLSASLNKYSNEHLEVLRQVKLERDSLLSEIDELKLKCKLIDRDLLTYKSRNQEYKIEIELIKKRNAEEVYVLKQNLALADDKIQVLKAKIDELFEENERLQQSLRLDVGMIKQKEKELENKLELLTLDAEGQIFVREQKILELRRKIDSLEFNMENVGMKEHRLAREKKAIEDKFNKVINTLRDSLREAEEDSNYQQLKSLEK